MKKPKLEIVIQLRGDVIAQMDKIIEKRIIPIYKKYPYAKIRIEVLG